LSLGEVNIADWQTKAAEGTLGHERFNAGDWSADCAIFESPE
jgi:hypothetical protein